MANITATQLSNSIPTLIAAQALGYLKANTVLAQLVSRDWDNEISQYGQTVNVPFTGALSVNDKTQGAVVTLQAPADTKVSVTLNKHKEVSFLVEDFGRALARPDFLQAYVGDGLALIAEQQRARPSAGWPAAKDRAADCSERLRSSHATSLRRCRRRNRS